MADTDAMDLSGLASSNTDDSNVGMPAGAGTPPFNPPAGGAEPTSTAIPGPGKAPMAAGPNNPPGSHAGLIGMLQGLAVATSAFGKAVATHGREGGAQDVLAYQEQQKQEARAAQDQKMKQADFDTRQKYMQAQTNSLIVRTQTDLAKAPDEIQKAHIDVQNAQIEMYEKAGVPPVVAVAMVQGESTQQHASNVMTAAGGDVVGNTAIPGHEGEFGSGQGKTNVYSFDQMAKVNIPKEMAAPTLAKLNGEIDVAEASGVDKNVIAQARARVQSLQGADSINGRDLFMVTTQVEAPIVNATAAKKAEIDTQTKQADLAEKQQKADPVFKLSQPEELAKPGSAASIQALIADPKTNPNDIPRLKALLPSAEVFARNAAAKDALDREEKQTTIAKNRMDLEEKKDENVVAYDPSYANADGTKGANVIMPRGQAIQNKLEHYKADPSMVNANVAGFNDVQTKINQLAVVANDPNKMSKVNPALAGAMLDHAGGIELGAFGMKINTSMINAKLYQEDVKNANPETREYVTAMLAAHEAITQLPRLQTFGKSSRMTQQQMEAAQSMLPAPGDDADMAGRKMNSLQTTIDPLRKQLPHMPGAELVPTWLEQKGSQQAAPAGSTHTFDAGSGRAIPNDAQRVLKNRAGNATIGYVDKDGKSVLF